MAEHDVSGMALAIVQAPYIPRACGYGVANAETGLLASTHTLWDIGRMRDAYTAVAVMQLVESGKLSQEEALAEIARRDADLRPLVERASGQPYQDFVRAGQIDFLGLKETCFGSELGKVSREQLSPGKKHSGFLHQLPLINPSEPAVGKAVDPDALYASAYDVSFWDIALAGDLLVKSPELRKVLYASGHGPWTYPGRPGLMVVTGSGNGFSSLLSRYTDPSDLVCVTLLANQEGLDLTQLARRIAGAYDARLGPPLETLSLRAQQSPYSVEDTVARLEQALTEAGIKVLGRVDHSAGARAANLELEPTYELIFGNPAVGTHLMHSNRVVAVDLPLRALVYSRPDGVWVTATDPVEIARRHGITDREELIFKMRAGVDRVLLAATTST